MTNKMWTVLIVALMAPIIIDGSYAQAQIGAKDRPGNVGLIGGVVLDTDSRPIAGATVDLARVDGDVSECSLRLYGPGGRMNKSVNTSSNGEFLIAFEWEPEQLECVVGGAQPQAYVNVLVFNEGVNRATHTQVRLDLAPNLPALFQGGVLKASGPIGERLNKRAKEAANNNPALKVYFRSISQRMSAEMYGLMGDAGTIHAEKP